MIDAVAAAFEAGVTDTGTAAEMTGTRPSHDTEQSGMTEASLIAIPHVVAIPICWWGIVASGLASTGTASSLPG